MEKKERWGILVDGVKLGTFFSQEEAEKYKEENLKGKDAAVFQYWEPLFEEFEGIGFA